MRIGVIGYSSQNFDQRKAKRLLHQAFDKIPLGEHTVVSGLTNLGIPALAYKEAKRRSWKTAGIACAKAFDYPRFPVDEVRIVGENWGDESETFLEDIALLIRIGGGKQSQAETKSAKQMKLEVWEFEL